MIVQCDGCNTKFRLDDSKVKGQGVRVRCTKCQSVFTVMPSPPSPSSEIPASQEETFDVSFGAKPESAPKTAAVDFSSFTGEPAPPKREEEKLESPQWGAGGIDLSFEGKPKEEPKTEFDISVPPSKEEPSFSFEEKTETHKPETGMGGFDFKIGGEAAQLFEAEKKEPSSFQETTGFGFDKDFAAAPAPEKISFEIEPPPKEEEFVVISQTTKEEAKTVIMQAPGIAASVPKAPEEGLLETGTGEAKEISFEVPSEGKSIITRIIIPIVVFLLVAGAGLFYLKAGTGFLQNVIGSKAAPQKVMDLIDLKGYYVDNPSAGRLFILQGKVINNLNKPKEVKGIHGILFDKNGKEVKDAWVAPGRILSQDELNTISAADLEKRFKDRKGAIPAQGIVPFMVVFQSIPNGLAEFSIEISQ